MLKLVRSYSSSLSRMFSSTEIQVIHNQKLKEFSLGSSKDKAVLQYKEISPSIIELEHTIVPESLQGQGIGKLLAEAALEYAIDMKLKVKVSCGFVKTYLEKYPKPEFKAVLLDKYFFFFNFNKIAPQRYT
ncbi:protein NATD1-like [Stegodyphus dumicola]|uniref:protein NATD1-like n=1 Tax=Stegodyphus dumicola TaxID=202533 RepID=UPI0015AC8E2B|nr:protein NATD1-like [Stegodyphus dumicola]